MTPESKKGTIESYRLHERDSGSQAIQVALLTSRISELSEHLKLHKKDHSSRRGLLKMVGKRASVLKYLMRTDRNQYQGLIQRLGLRK